MAKSQKKKIVPFEQIPHVFGNHSKENKMLLHGHVPKRVCNLSEERNLNTRHRPRMRKTIKYNNVLN